MELLGTLLSPSMKKNKQYTPQKKFLIFQEMELLSYKIKNFIIFQVMELSSTNTKKFFIFPEMKLSGVIFFLNLSQEISEPEKWKKLALKKFLVFSQKKIFL